MHRPFLPPRRRRRGFSLIELLVVVVLLIALGSALTYFMAGKSRSKPGEAIHTPTSRARDVECMENIRQVRAALTMAQSSDTDGKYPASLAELKGLPKEMLSCAVGGEPYVYDPATGQVHCQHPGHNRY